MSQQELSADSTQATKSFTDNSADNESIVLNSILKSNSLMENIDLTVNDFTTKENKEMFSNMQAQYNEDGYIELKELLGDLDPKYVDDYQNMIESNSVSDITRYVNRMKEASNKQAIEDSLKKHIKSLDKNLNSSTVIAELSKTVTDFEKKFSKPKALFDIQNLANIQVEQPNFYLEKFLPIQKNEITMLSAGGGSGKSYLGILLLSLLNKKYDLNIFAWFSEDPTGIVKHRANKLESIYNEEIDINFDILGKGNALGFITKDRNGNLQASEFFQSFKQQMKKYDVLLLDPLIQFIGNIDENNNAEIRFLFNLLNTWCDEEKKTLIIIHHHNKGTTDAKGNRTSSARGASAIIDAVRVHYSIIKKKNDDDNRYLKVEKANHFQGKNEYKIKLFSNEVSTNNALVPLAPQVSKEDKKLVDIVEDCEESYDEIPF